MICVTTPHTLVCMHIGTESYGRDVLVSPTLCVCAVGEELDAAIVKQIEFYFSPSNLSHDAFLVSKMNEKLQVATSVVTNFPGVKVRSATAQAPFSPPFLRFFFLPSLDALPDPGSARVACSVCVTILPMWCEW